MTTADNASRGGNDPAIICDDVNIDEVAPKVSPQQSIELSVISDGGKHRSRRSLF